MFATNRRSDATIPVGAEAGKNTRSAIWRQTRAADRRTPLNRIAALCLFACLPAFCADQVVLTNGDIITGAIVKKDGARLTIKSEFLGEVTMPWSAVKSLRSDAELNVVLP